jgi:2-oxoglutarate ferredoxin oxidoreductase subunit alpha
MQGEVRLLQGNEACVEGALAAGVRFFAGYPITPSSEIAEGMAAKLPRYGGRFIQMEDEIASIAACLGASIGGLKPMTATSGPGYSLMQENIGYACLSEIPVVIVNVMRGGPSTGLPTLPSQGDVMQARWGTHGDHPAVALCPWSVREMLDLTVRATNISERYRTPVTLLADEVVAHMREKVQMPRPGEVEVWDRPHPAVPPDAYVPFAPDPATEVPPMADFGAGYRWNITGLMHDEEGFPTMSPAQTSALVRRLHRKVEGARRDLPRCDERWMSKARIAVVAYGSTARSALSAVRQAREMGMPVGLIRPVTIWPFPAAEITELTASVDVVLVVEMNLGQLIGEVQRVLAGRAAVVPLCLYDGELIKPSVILQALMGGPTWNPSSSAAEVPYGH